MKNILTKQVALIQGPPGIIFIINFNYLIKKLFILNKLIGTGKTYVGALGVKILLDNKKFWIGSNS